MHSVESILAEIDAAVEKPLSKTAATVLKEVPSLIQKLASAADALDSNAMTPQKAEQIMSGQFTTDQNLIDKLAESRVVFSGAKLMQSLPEAINFSKVAAARGHDALEAFRFFLAQRTKELDY